MVDRRGYIEAVSVGTNFDIDFPLLTRLRATSTRLSGYRLLFTKLNQKGFSKKDRNILYDRRLDAIGCIEVEDRGQPGFFHLGHLKPEASGFDSIEETTFDSALDIDFPFDEWVENLEDEFQKIIQAAYVFDTKTKAILCYLITPENKANIDDEIEETLELAKTAGLSIVGKIAQVRPQPDPKYFYGKGKAKDLVQDVISKNADMILFHQDLTATQFRIVGDHTEVPIIDRTQLILDIFAQRAKTHEGKLQVELAQLQYTLPRLREKNTQMSRLVGGIGGRGPGETKLEIHRRRAREKVAKLQREIDKIKETRMIKRQARNKNKVPIVSIVGYTNAGKSTLLNTLTQSKALAEDKLFATLDPFSKRLRFPQDQEIILTDTVGFIRDLPPALMDAFAATLEEIRDASLILHLIDASNPHCEKHIQIVEQILHKLGSSDIPQIKVFNKMDNVDQQILFELIQRHDGIGISALQRKTLGPLIEYMQECLKN
ncbi:MAG: GTPase HflX [Bdellovibrionales bacterium]|nr:GTPase HflX [Bdellovibrionales bacterium]